MKKFLIVIMILFLFGVGCEYSKNEISYSGRVEATAVDISSEIGGEIIEFAVSEGDKVNAGDFLVKLDDQEAKLKVEEAQAAVEAARARLDEALSGTRSQKLDSAEAAIENIEVNLQQAEKDLEYYSQQEERYKKLYETGAIDKEKYESVELALEKAKSNVNSLKAQLEQAVSELKLLEEGNTSNYIVSLRAEKEKVEKIQEQAELQLERCTINSPLDGVVALKNYEEGELVNPGSYLLTILNLEEQWIDIYVPQSDLGKWHLEDEVSIVADSYPGEEFSGKVIYIATEAEFTPKNVQTKEARMDTVFKIKIRVIDGNDKLRPGMWVEVYRGEEM